MSEKQDMCVYEYIYIYTCVCVCMYVCENEEFFVTATVHQRHFVSSVAPGASHELNSVKMGDWVL